MLLSDFLLAEMSMVLAFIWTPKSSMMATSYEMEASVYLINPLLAINQVQWISIHYKLQKIFLNYAWSWSSLSTQLTISVSYILHLMACLPCLVAGYQSVSSTCSNIPQQSMLLSKGVSITEVQLVNNTPFPVTNLCVMGERFEVIFSRCSCTLN